MFNKLIIQICSSFSFHSFSHPPSLHLDTSVPAIAKFLKEVKAYCDGILESLIKRESFRIEKDLGHSIFHQKVLKFALSYDRYVAKSTETHVKVLEALVSKYKNTLKERQFDDNEILRILLSFWNKYLKEEGDSILNKEQKGQIVA